MKILIFLNGDPPSKELILSYMNERYKVIAIDGAANYLYEYNIVPHVLIGDFDSIDKTILSYYEKKNVLIERHNPIKDLTDGELGMKKALEYNPIKIILFGGFGGRVDQLLGNIGMLKIPLRLKTKAYLIGNNTVLFLKDKPFKLNFKKNSIFSLFSIDGEVKNLSITGAKYNLNKYDLAFGDSRTISNEIVEKNVSISFDSGILGVILNQ